MSGWQVGRRGGGRGWQILHVSAGSLNAPHRHQWHVTVGVICIGEEWPTHHVDGLYIMKLVTSPVIL